LADKKNNRLIYVGISFTDNFTDINYKKIINEEYLPINFNAKYGNSTQKKEHEKFMETQKNNRSD